MISECNPAQWTVPYFSQVCSGEYIKGYIASIVCMYVYMYVRAIMHVQDRMQFRWHEIREGSPRTGYLDILLYKNQDRTLAEHGDMAWHGRSWHRIDLIRFDLVWADIDRIWYPGDLSSILGTRGDRARAQSSKPILNQGRKKRTNLPLPLSSLVR